jgi:hypothetical protein
MELKRCRFVPAAAATNRESGNKAVAGALPATSCATSTQEGVRPVSGLIYLIGLIVVIMAILSFFGLR